MSSRLKWNVRERDESSSREAMQLRLFLFFGQGELHEVLMYVFSKKGGNYTVWRVKHDVPSLSMPYPTIHCGKHWMVSEKRRENGILPCFL